MIEPLLMIVGLSPVELMPWLRIPLVVIDPDSVMVIVASPPELDTVLVLASSMVCAAAAHGRASIKAAPRKWDTAG